MDHSPALVQLRTLFLFVVIDALDGHGWMTYPPSRNGGGLDDDIDKCLSDAYYNGYKNINVTNDCMWFTSSTVIPGEPTLCDPALLTTSTSIANACSADHDRDWTRKHPWRSPGTAGKGNPKFQPCGVNSGSKPTFPDPPAAGQKQFANGTDLPPTRITTKWKIGSIVDAGWSIYANHGGGYSYRLCKKEKGKEVTEECFQQTQLNFASNFTTINNSMDRLVLKITCTRLDFVLLMF